MMAITISDQTRLVVFVLIFVLVLNTILIVNLQTVSEFEEETLAAYERRINMVDLLLETDRDLYQSFTALLLILQTTNPAGDAVNLDDLGSTLTYEAVSNADQALERFEMFSEIFDTDYPGNRIFQDAKIAFIQLHPIWRDSLISIIQSSEKFAEYKKRDFQQQFGRIREEIDVLTELSLSLTHVERDQLKRIAIRARWLYVLIFIFSILFIPIIIWISILFSRTRVRMEEHKRILQDTEQELLLGGMVKSISHHVNTPLGNILSAVSYLKDIEDSENKIEGLEIIQRATENLSDMFASIRAAYSGGDTAVLDPIPLTALLVMLNECCLQHSVGCGFEIFAEQETNAKDIYCLADQYIFIEVAKQIIENTSRFAEKPHLSIQIRYEPKRVVIRFSNSGPQISLNIAPTVFLPFRSGSDFKFTGLGLFLAKRLATTVLGGDLILAENTFNEVSFDLSIIRAESEGA